MMSKVFPFGILLYLLCLALQGILGSKNAYKGGLLVASLYLVGGLAYCLGSHTMEDFYLTLLLTILQGIVFIGSRIYTDKYIDK